MEHYGIELVSGQSWDRQFMCLISPMKNTTKLKELLSSNSPEMIMESHSGLSAKIAQETGFKSCGLPVCLSLPHMV